LITRLKLPPLIVTLGSFSLFRGLAEAITRGVDNFTGFPASFLFLGQGYLFGVIPAQLPILVVAAIGIWLLVHRSTFGRSFRAIGFSPDGTRYAGIPVEQRVGFVYVLSGIMSALAALIYVARVGQAKADAGVGYELLAITAVVLGGTSIFGGIGTVHGTLLGLAVLAVLKNGLTLSDMPSELAGILTGVLLLTVLAGEALAKASPVAANRRPNPDYTLSIHCSLTLASECLPLHDSYPRLIFYCTRPHLTHDLNVTQLSLRTLTLSTKPRLKQLTTSHSMKTLLTTFLSLCLIFFVAERSRGADKQLTIAMMPKSKGNAYFISCRKGAEQAAKDLGVKLLWDGPTEPDPARQNEIVETWITRGVDVIAVSVENKEGLSTALRKAKEKGIKIITWDADAEADSRDFLINQATPEGSGSH
jgi:rhamnose transport system permease protein